MNPRILFVEYLKHYKLLLTFTSKEVKEFDLSGYLNFPVYTPLTDEAFCSKAKVFNGTVIWDENIDFDPDTLYLDSSPVPFTA